MSGGRGPASKVWGLSSGKEAESILGYKKRGVRVNIKISEIVLGNFGNKNENLTVRCDSTREHSNLCLEIDVAVWKRVPCRACEAAPGLFAV